MPDRKAPLDGPAWEDLARLYEQAVACPPAERAAFVSRAAADRPELAAEVEAMLAADESPVLVELERGLAARSAGVASDTGAGPGDAGPLPPGTQVGDYSLVRPIGRGGMGEVYLAERAGGAFSQQVAIKLMRGGVVGTQALARFERERQIQASLSHPSVVPLLDAGVAADGRPYLVLQYVEGRPITEDADRRRLSVEARLRRFVEVCRAVQYAHSRLVVHRDIKPSNIVVTPDGAIRLLDFGIAKLLADDPVGEQAGLTRGAPAPMTPERAAPEQLCGEAVTTATDVWGLGVLLFELLAGRLPFEEAGAGAAGRGTASRQAHRLAALPTGERGHALAEARSTSLARLRRQLGGDLATVVAKALRQEPERRYASAADLADDVERVLQGRPVSALPDSLGYRLRRFVGRHRVEAGLAAAALSALAVAAVSTVVQSARVARERDRARAEEQRAGAVVELLGGLFGATAPTAGAGVGAVSIDQLLKEGDSRVAALAGQPAVQARMYRTLGRIRRERSEFVAARELLERALSAHAAAGAAGHDPERLEAVFEMARILHRLDRSNAAVELVRRELPPLEAAGQPARAALAEALRLLGEHLAGGPEAEAALRRSLALRRGLHSDPAALAGSLDALAAHLWAGGAREEARSLWQEALPLLEAARGKDHLETLAVLANLVLALKDPLEQAALQRRLIEAHERQLGPRSFALANDWNNLGVMLARARDYAGAEDALRRSLALRAEIQGDLHRDTVSTLRNVARALELQGRHGESLAAFDEVVRRLRRGGAAPERLAHYRIQRAQVVLRLGRVSEAELLARQALATLRAARPVPEADVAGAALVLGRVALARSDAKAALEPLRESVGIRERLYDRDDPRTAETRAELGRALLEGGDKEGAALLRAALPVLRGWGQLHRTDLEAAERALAAAR